VNVALANPNSTSGPRIPFTNRSRPLVPGHPDRWTWTADGMACAVRG
jgi:hypothetical protein